MPKGFNIIIAGISYVITASHETLSPQGKLYMDILLVKQSPVSAHCPTTDKQSRIFLQNR